MGSKLSSESKRVDSVRLVPTFEKNVDMYTYHELTHFDTQIIFDLASGRHPLAFKNLNIFQNSAKNNFSDYNKKNIIMTIIDIC